MQINLTFDSSFATGNAPQSFKEAIQAAANIIDAAFTDNITVNIVVGYGEYPGDGSAVTGGSGYGGDVANLFSYSSTLSLLQQDLVGAVQSGVAALPAGSSVQGFSKVHVATAEQKVFGLMPATATGADGDVGFATDVPLNDLIPLALHELTHAMGRVPQGPQPDVFDLFRYTGKGTLLFDNGPTPDTAAYFSLDGGTTDIADYGTTSDPSDFLNSSKTPNDPFNEFYTASTLQFLSPMDILQMEALGFHALVHPVGDYHGVGASDILWRNSGGDLTLWGSGVGSGPLQSTQDFGLISTAWQVEQIGDFSGDGRADILWRNTSTNEVGLWNSVPNGATLSFANENLGVVASTWQVVGSGDFTGDGPDQILWRNTSTGDLGLWSGHAAKANVIYADLDLGLVATQWQVAGVGDFNGDGKADILWRNSSTNDVGLWISNPGAGPVTFTFQDSGLISSAWQIQGVGDLNGDGKADIVWRNSSTNDLSLWLGDGAGGFTFQDLGPAASNWHIQQVSDLNGDGKADILWRDDAGDVGWWTGGANGDAITFTAHILGNVPTNWLIESDWHGT